MFLLNLFRSLSCLFYLESPIWLSSSPVFLSSFSLAWSPGVSCGYIFPPSCLFTPSLLLHTFFPSALLPVCPSCSFIFRLQATTRIPMSNTQSWTLPFWQRHPLVTEPPFLWVEIWLSTQPSRLMYASARHCQPFSLQVLSSRYVKHLFPSPQCNLGQCSSCLWDVSSILPFFFLPAMRMVLVMW